MRPSATWQSVQEGPTSSTLKAWTVEWSVRDPFSLMPLGVSLVKIREKLGDMRLKPWQCQTRDVCELRVALPPSSDPHSCTWWLVSSQSLLTQKCIGSKKSNMLSVSSGNNLVLLSPISSRQSLKDYYIRNNFQRHINLSPAQNPRVSF